MQKRESMQKASPRFKLANIDGKTPTPEVKKEKITNWKDSPHLISLKRGVEKHGKDWNAIQRDKTLNLPSNLTIKSLSAAYYAHLRSQFKHLEEASKNSPMPPDRTNGKIHRIWSVSREVEKHGKDWNAIYTTRHWIYQVWQPSHWEAHTNVTYALSSSILRRRRRIWSNGKIHRIWSVSRVYWEAWYRLGRNCTRQDIEFTINCDN